jgi:hypothetical protein
MVRVDGRGACVVQDGQRSLELVGRFLYLLDVLVVIDREDDKPVFGEFFRYVFDCGKLPQTGVSSNTPELEQHGLPLELRERDILARERRKLELWSRNARLQRRRRHRFDKARRPPRRDRDRRQNQNGDH